MRIERDIINKFKEWKDAEKHKPILLKGARQIGKTWAMEEFLLQARHCSYSMRYKNVKKRSIR